MNYKILFIVTTSVIATCFIKFEKNKNNLKIDKKFTYSRVI